MVFRCGDVLNVTRTKGPLRPHARKDLSKGALSSDDLFGPFIYTPIRREGALKAVEVVEWVANEVFTVTVELVLYTVSG